MRAMLDSLLLWTAGVGGIAQLVELAGKGTLWLVAAGGTVWLLRGAGAAARHLVWALALAGLLILPAAGALLPPLRGVWTPAPAALVAPATPEPMAPPVDLVVRSTAVVDLPAPTREENVSVAAPAPRRIAWPALVIVVWALGAGVVLGWLAVSLLRVARLRRGARIETDGRWRRLVDSVAAEVGVRRSITILRSAWPAMPATWGVWRPVVLLPPEADRWPVTRCRDVLRHELAHVRRGDWVTQLVASVACALHWFNPLVWMAARAMRAERERACDDLVLRAGTRPSDYAGHLLDIARAFRTDAVLAGMTLARAAQLEGRLLDVLDPRRRRSGVSARQLAAAACGAVALVLPLAAAAPAAVAAVGASPPMAAWGFETLVPPPAVVAVVSEPATPEAGVPVERLLIADTLPECVGNAPRDEDRHGVHVSNGVALTTTVGRCWLRFVAEGKVAFTEDFTDVASIPSGGHVSLETDNGEIRRQLEIFPGAGTLERRYRVNGAEHPYDPEARRWVAGALTMVMRSSGIAAEERAAWILAQQGPTGLLAELEELRGDYARRLYAQYALSRGRLDVAERTRLLQWAGEHVGSDYELAEILITAARGPLEPAVQTAFVAATRTLDSDYEQRRVLSTALARAELDASGAAAVLEAAQGIESDYELAQLLVQWQRGRTLDASLRPAFFRAAGSLQSDYEQRRVLSAVIARGSADEGLVAATLESARALESDYELAELLTAVAELYPLGAKVRPAFFGAAATLQSDHERGRTLKAAAARTDLDQAAVGAVLTAAADISSGYERAEVLIAVAQRQRLEGATRTAFMEAARGLGEYDYNRVMGALGRTRGSI